jgi:ATP-binding cassette subfamily C protein
LKQAVAILADVYRHSGYSLAAATLLMIIAGVADGIGMVLLIPMLESAGIVGSYGGDGSSFIDRAFRGVFSWIGISPTFAHIAVALIVLFGLQSALVTLQSWMVVSIQKKYLASWQIRLFDRFISMRWSCFIAHKSGELVNYMLVESPRVSAAFFAIMQLLVALVIMCVYLVVALLASWRMTLYLLAASVPLFLMLWPVRSAVRRFGDEFGPINARLATTLNEFVSGAKVIKVNAGERRAKAWMAAQIDELCTNQIWSAFLPSTYRSVFEFGAILVILGAFYYGLNAREVGPAQLLLLVGLVARLLPRMMQMQVYYSSLHLALPGYAILDDVVRRFAENRERLAISSSNIRYEPESPIEICARELTVKYGDRPVLNGASFVIRPKQVVGFVGPSGGGKTTLIDSILGLTETFAGKITVGGVPLEEMDIARWRRSVGYVSQESFLFHDTIANNIRWNAPDASMESVEAAARAVGLAEVIAGLPDRYDTIVGDRGAALSGGQRQRICIARALVHRPALLILDEATSALDTLSEQAVVRMLESLRSQVTVAVVAHRLNAVRGADYIYVLDQGRIVEEGTWQTLIENEALFQRLVGTDM